MKIFWILILLSEIPLKTKSWFFFIIERSELILISCIFRITFWEYEFSRQNSKILYYHLNFNCFKKAKKWLARFARIFLLLCTGISMPCEKRKFIEPRFSKKKQLCFRRNLTIEARATFHIYAFLMLQKSHVLHVHLNMILLFLLDATSLFRRVLFLL